MILKSFNNFFRLLILICIFVSPLQSEDKIDIWKKNKEKSIITDKNQNSLKKLVEEKIETNQKIELNEKIEIENNSIESSTEAKFTEFMTLQNLILI